MTDPDQEKWRHANEARIDKAALREELKEAIRQAFDESRAIDHETHTSHHEWLAVQIKEAAIKMKARERRQIFVSKIAAGSLVAAFTLAVGWISHTVSDFLERHFH